MKYRLFISIMFFVSSVVFSQNPDFDENAVYLTPLHGGHPSYTACSWSMLPNSPMGVSRSCCVNVIVNGVPYMYQFGGGNSNSDLRRVARLNLNTNTWSNNYSSMPYGMSAATALAFSGDSVVYVVGGNNPTLGKTLKYNVYSNSWQTVSDMPTRVTDAFVVKYGEEGFFVIGGGDGYFGSGAMKTNVIQFYNKNLNSYTQVGTYPMPCAMLGGGIYQDTIIAVGGYITGGNATDNCFKGYINPSNHTISWQAIDPYPAGPIVRFASYTVVSGEGKGIVCTGGAVNGITPVASTFLWNFCTQNWQGGLPDNNQARSNYKACGKSNSVIYTASGYTTTGVGTSERLTFIFIDGPCNMNEVTGTPSVVPDKLTLQQNYPNPFNPSTVIKFGIPKAGEVYITVTDIAGRTVKEVHGNYPAAGNYQITFDGSLLSSGVYFYSVVFDNSRETRKMLLVK